MTVSVCACVCVCVCGGGGVGVYVCVCGGGGGEPSTRRTLLEGNIFYSALVGSLTCTRLEHSEPRLFQP